MGFHCFLSDQTEQRLGQRRRPDKEHYDAERLNVSQQRKEDIQRRR
jgi:hypothetical protein